MKIERSCSQRKSTSFSLPKPQFKHIAHADFYCQPQPER